MTNKECADVLRVVRMTATVGEINETTRGSIMMLDKAFDRAIELLAREPDDEKCCSSCLNVGKWYESCMSCVKQSQWKGE